LVGVEGKDTSGGKFRGRKGIKGPCWEETGVGGDRFEKDSIRGDRWQINKTRN